MKHIDHIDPMWLEGRTYQKVCGLPVPLNFSERDASFNITKSNRFLPWRVTLDELGSEPTEPGDMCWFLDPDTNDWVLAEFLGEWWFEKSKRTCGPSAGKVGKPRPDVAARNHAAKGSKRQPHSEETKAKMSEAGKRREFSPETRAKMSASAKARAHRPGETERRSKQSKLNNIPRSSNGQFTKS